MIPVEMVAGTTDAARPSKPSRPERSRRARRLRRLALPAVAAAIAAATLVLAQSPEQPEAAARIDHFYFADPFALDWIALESVSQRAAAGLPEPMASLEPPCFGFGRPDWPASDRQPTVAYCLDPEPGWDWDDGGALVLKEHLAGGETWHLLVFADAVDGIEFSADGQEIAADRVYRNDRFVAVLAPADTSIIETRWETPSVDCQTGPIAEGRITAMPCGR